MTLKNIGNTILRYSSILLLFTMTSVPAVMLTSCHDEPVIDNPDNPENPDVRMISFSLPANHFSFAKESTPVIVSLISPDGLTQTFDAVVENIDDTLRFKMALPSGDSIADGKYIMTLRHGDGNSIPGRLSCLFEREALKSVNIILPTYMLPGSGTEEDPYIIAGDSDFEMFLINLADDSESFGAGLKFKQTADVVAPDQSSLIPGRGYWGSPFAGIYDGGGHAITGIYYRGSNRENSDSGFGIFQKLIGSATVKNLSVTGADISGLYKESGIIAGSVSGDVMLENISISGHIEGGRSQGCLAGIVTGGSLKVENVELKAHVSGTDNIGGLVGKINTGAKVSFNKISTPDTHFLVEGKSHVGGIVGESAASVSFRNIRIDHKVSNEDSDIRIVEGRGDGTGGIIGSVTGNIASMEFSDCYVLCPVGGKEASSVGALAGSVECAEMNVSNCRSYSVVGGKSYVGGLFGKVTIPQMCKGLTISGEDFSTRVSVDDADASVTGIDHVGGFAGWWEGPNKINTKVKINVPVTSSGSGAGGAFGGVINSTVDATQFLIGSGNSGTNTLHITGNKEVGGIVGRLEKSTLSSDSNFDFPVSAGNASVPKPEQFTSAFNGVVTGTSEVGGIVGYGLMANVTGVHSTAHVTGSQDVGGVIGKMEDATYDISNIEDCSFNGILECSAADMTGGIVGQYRSVGSGFVHDCVNYADIIGGDSEGGTAGIIGYIYKTKQNDTGKVLQVKWCVNMAKVSGSMHVGGIVGRSQAEDSYTKLDGPNTTVAISISDCMNRGSIHAEGGSSSRSAVGGILGFSNFLTGVFRCANHGEVYGQNVCHGIGGIAGSMGEDPKGAGLTTLYRNVLVQQCFNKGTVNAGNRDSFVGGILGYQEEGQQSNLEDCANHGTIVPDQHHDSGGILGCADHLTYIYRCVNRGKVNHGNATVGTHKTASTFYHNYLYFLEGTGGNWPDAIKFNANEFTLKVNFSGLDFTNVWKMTSEGPMLSQNRWNYL
ncbi:MAG: hypothetical protein K2N05_10625 [Muribaculaceae bacterium]|nr:hypothetical protein [Muribaculaceae bacterium]